MNYDVETGIHDVFLTMKGISELSTSSTSSQSSHVAEFSNGMMKAVPRRGNGSVSSHVSSDRHTNSSERAAVDLQEASVQEQMANSDNIGAVYSSIKCPGKANSLNVLTDLGLEDDISPSISSASETSSDYGASTQSEPGTNATSPTFSLPQDFLELHTRQGEASTTVPALDLEEKPSNSKFWQFIPFQWLDMAISDRQYYHWKEIQEKEEPESVQEDQNVDICPRLSGPGEVERPLRLEDVDLDAIFGQAATDLDDNGLPQEAIVLYDETVTEENGIDPVGTPNDYQADGPEFHHLNLLRNRVYQAYDHWSYSYPDRQMKQQKGWESPERLGDSKLRFVLDEDSITERHAPAATPTSYEVAEPTNVYEDENGYVEDNFVFPANESGLEDMPGACEADERYQAASSLRSLLASSSLTHGAMSPPNEGRYFTPRIREDSGESDDMSESSDGEVWETDENGAFVSPRKGKERLKGGMDEDNPSGTLRADEDSLGIPVISFGQLISPKVQGEVSPAFTICRHEEVDLPPMGILRFPEPETGPMVPTEDATEGENALPMPVEEPSSQEDISQAELSLPYCKYNDLSEIPLRSNPMATIGQATRKFGRWLTENMLW